MWEGGRHALPPAKPPAGITGGGGGGLNYTWNASAPAVQRAPHPLGVDWGAVLIVFTVAVVVLVAAAITYMYSRGLALPRGNPPRAARRGMGGDEAAPIYSYEGLRRELRRIYEALLERLVGLGVVLRPGYTPREVARASASTSLGGVAGWLASVYERYMYGPEHPPRSIVEEARRRVEGRGG